MFTHIDWLVHLEHHQDLLREAEQERLARLAVAAQPVRKVGKKTAIVRNNQPKSTGVVYCTSSTT